MKPWFSEGKIFGWPFCFLVSTQLTKIPPVVNLITVKRTIFLYERCVLAAFSSYMYVEKRRSYEKCVRKMLMKLTPDFPFHLYILLTSISVDLRSIIVSFLNLFLDQGTRDIYSSGVQLDFFVIPSYASLDKCLNGHISIFICLTFA